MLELPIVKLRGNASAIAVACALLCCVAAAGWQAAVARFDYGGNWTAFFRTGSLAPLPPAAAHESLYRFQSGGYDGQYYHLIAQDPLLLHGTVRYIDHPRLRYRRILLPALAWLTAFGRPATATYTYIAMVILFLGLGAYWLSRYAVLVGRSPWWGMAFFLVPAAFLSLDRLTVDIALAALTIGFALYWRSGPLWKLYLVLVLAPLARETGFLLLAAYCLHAVFERHWSRAAAMASAGIPAATWFLYVQRQTPDRPEAWLQIPFQAAMEVMLHPERYPLRKWFITPLEYLAWMGLILAIAMAIGRCKRDNPLCLAAFFFAVFAATINFTVWDEAEAFGRVFTPLLVLLPLAQPDRWSLLPLLAILPRALTYPTSETVGVFRALLRH
ncbi:MAG: hypothetical protein ACLQKA_16495 [Bryobacteraceae bacterium]